MSIRKKLILSYAAMMIIPLLLIVLTTVLRAVVSHSDFQYYKQLFFSTTEKFEYDDQFHLLKEIRRTNERSPELLTDQNYFSEIDTELQLVSSGLIVRVANQLQYTSQAYQLNQRLLDSLPPYVHPGIHEGTVKINEGNEIYILFQYDYTAASGTPGSVFIVSKVDPFVYWARDAFPSLFTALVIILVLTHVMLTYFVSRSIIRPLLTLRQAARRVKDGELDFEVGINGKDEIGQLGLAFEEMRVQLRHSIALQLQYEENRKELISNISHDLKTPITTIKGYVDGILEGVADSPEKIQKYMETISNKAEEMDRLIDELFLYSKLDLKRVPFDFESVDLQAFVMDWAEEMQFELDKLGFDWFSEVEIAGNTSVLLDLDQIKRVLNNVVVNSIKYMDKQEKQIRMHTYVDQGQVIMEIRDNGPGIAAEALPHVFERFYRAEQSRNSLTGGSGLGLAIARQIMEGHHGQIEAFSTHGEGTLIKLTLPIQRKEGDDS